MPDWKAEIRAAFATKSLDEDVLEELTQHAEATYASARAEGMDRIAGEAVVRAEIRAWVERGGELHHRPKRVVTVLPPAASHRRVDGWLKDLQYALRLIARQPGHTALVVTTIALGISAALVLASVAYAVLLKPLPWADAPRLVRLYETREGSTRRLLPMMTNGSYLAWQQPEPKTLDALGAWSQRNLTLLGLGDPQQVRGIAVTPGLFEILGAAPLMGRSFAPGDERQGAADTVIVSFGFWQQYLGARADVIGQPLQLDGKQSTIIGVMPSAFAFPNREAALWVPLYITPVTRPGVPGNSLSLFQAIGRLRPGATPAQATAEGTARGRTAAPGGPVAMAVFGSNGALQVSAVSMLDALTGDVREPIVLMVVAVLLLLAIATANVASLQLARSVARRREFAVRAALGAGRGRLLRQTLIENAAIGLCAGILALLIAAAVHRVLPMLLPPDFPRVDEITFDLRVQALGVVLSLMVGLAFGLLPALQTGHRDIMPLLLEDGIAPVGGGMRSPVARMRAVIMAGQVALACVLLVGAALLGRSFLQLTATPLGVDASNLLTARVVVRDECKPETCGQLLDRIATRLRAMPGVTGVAYATSAPFSGSMALSSFPLKKRDGGTEQIQTGVQSISPGYFAALGQRVVEGREFTAADTATGAFVVIVNREFSRRYLDGRALGWSLPGNDRNHNQAREIVGIVENTVRQSVTDPPAPELYVPGSQAPIGGNVNVFVRGSADPRALVPLLRNAVREEVPHAPLDSIKGMEDLVSATLARPRLYGLLLGTFAAFALAIAGVGLFGVLSYSVAQRGREIAVRTALGAERRDVLWLVSRQTAAIVGVGLAAGLVVSLWASTLLANLVYGVTTHDPASFGIVAAVLAAVALLASIGPARRAAQVDPVRLLRG